MLRQLGITGVVIAVAFCLSAIAATSASADECMLTAFPKEGNHNVNTCADVAAALGEYTYWELATYVSSGLWCARGLPTELLQKWADARCLTAAVPVDTGRYALVVIIAPPLPGALPDMAATLSGASYPAHFRGSSTKAKTTFTSSAGAVLEGEGITLLLTVKELSASGEFAADFAKVTAVSSKEKCNTAGDAAGIVLISGVSHLVITPAGAADLFSLKEVELTCGKTEVLLKGSVISTFNTEGASEEITKLSGAFEGEKGKQKLTEYYNSSGTITKATLLSNAGTGFVLTDEAISEPFKLEVLEGGMVMVVIS